MAEFGIAAEDSVNGGRRRAAMMAAIAMLLGGLMGTAASGQVGEPAKVMSAGVHPEFEVATIKPSDPNNHSSGFETRGRHIFVENETLSTMLIFAYGVHPKQVVGGPDWLGTDHFDIDGVADVEGIPNVKQQQEVLQKLLANRFGLTFHREKREMGVYAVTLAKGGPKLTAGDPNGTRNQSGNGNGGQHTYRFTNNNMEDFALCMQFYLDRPVVDQTGLAGRWNFVLKWTLNETATNDPNAAPGLFTAVQEQLGLKLEPIRASAEVLVVDHVERPSVN